MLNETHLVVRQAYDLTSIDLATAELTELEKLAGLRVMPSYIVDGHVIAETLTSRGTPCFGLASFDLATGGSDWAVDLGVDQVDADALVDPRRVQLRPIDPTTQHVLLDDPGAELLVVTCEIEAWPGD